MPSFADFGSDVLNLRRNGKSVRRKKRRSLEGSLAEVRRRKSVRNAFKTSCAESDVRNAPC